MNNLFPLAAPVANSTKITFSSGKTFYISSGSQKETESTHNTFISQLEQTSFGNAGEWSLRKGKRRESQFKSANVSIDRREQSSYNDHVYSVLQCPQKTNLMMENLKIGESQAKKQAFSSLSYGKPLRRHKIFENHKYKMSQQSSSVDLSNTRTVLQTQRKKSVYEQRRLANINYIQFDRKVGKTQSQQIPCYKQPNFKHILADQVSRNDIIDVNNVKSDFKFRKNGRLSFKEGDFKKITQTSLQYCVQLQRKSQSSLQGQIQLNKSNIISDKEAQIKPLFKNFKEEGQQNQLQFNEQISNIEQDNSQSRYFDNDTVLPFINKISYQNVDISNLQSAVNNDAIPNIFVDFEKSIGSPLLFRRKNRENIYYDSVTIKNTSNMSGKSEIKHLFPSQEIAKKKNSMFMSFLSILLIALSVMMLIVQVAA